MKKLIGLIALITVLFASCVVVPVHGPGPRYHHPYYHHYHHHYYHRY